MKRVFIIQNTPLNEPLPLSVYLTDLLRNFKKNEKHEINLIISKSKFIPKKIKTLCNKIYQLDTNTYSIKDNIRFSFKVNSILRKENKKKKISIIHCIYPNSSLLGGVLFKMTHQNSELVYDVRSPWIDMSIERGFINPYIAPIYKKVIYFEEKMLCKFVDKFIFITEGLKKHYKKKVKIKNKQKVYTSPSGADLKIFKKTKANIRKKYDIKENEILIGSVGGIAKIRKLDEFLYLFKKITLKNKDVKLMFVGEGDSLQDLKDLTKKLDLKKKVIFVGKVDHREVPKYISSFDFGLCHLPNIKIYENSIPLKILEYLSCKIQVLASELKAHNELKEKLSGIHIYKNAEDISNIMKKREKRINNPGLKEYSWPILTNKYEKIWSGLG
jgi:glycosyltransferase involved in cell wall biosynthesis